MINNFLIGGHAGTKYKTLVRNALFRLIIICSVLVWPESRWGDPPLPARTVWSCRSWTWVSPHGPTAENKLYRISICRVVCLVQV